MLAGLCVDLVVAALIAMLLAPAAAWAQAQMPDPSQMSGVPLPVADVAPGTVSVRVIRGAFTNNIEGASVVFTIDGQTRTVKTDANGRAEVSSLKPGTRVTAVVVVDGKRIESQPITIGASGIRVALVAPDPDAEKRAAEDAKLAAGPAVKGVVALGPESRIVVEPAEDALNVFYVLDILNTARTPVDIGGPFVVNLPAEALGPGLLDGSSPQAKVIGTHVTVLGPFQPGTTEVQVGFGLPYSTSTARLEQRFQVALPSVNFLLAQKGAITFTSLQLPTHGESTQDGQPVLVAQGPELPAGQALTIDFSGLPHRPLWPRYTALGLAVTIVAFGMWVAFRRPAADSQPAGPGLRAERDRLLADLAALERRYRAGRVSDAAYAGARETLVQELEAVYARLDELAAA